MTNSVAIAVNTQMRGRQIARVVRCAGGAPELIALGDDWRAAAARLAASIICIDAELLNRAHDPSATPAVLLVLSDNNDLLLTEPVQQGPVSHVLGLRYADGPPRTWELLAVLRRLLDQRAPSPKTLLLWGGLGFESSPGTNAERDDLVASVHQVLEPVVGSRQSNTIAEVAHELLMNAMFDAPVDSRGVALYAHARTGTIALPPPQRPRFFCGCDGAKAVLAIADPFGRLQRQHVFRSLSRALESGTLDRSGGGAGLGLAVIHRATTQLFFDVVPGKLTQVTAVLELDIPHRELRRVPRSVHYFLY